MKLNRNDNCWCGSGAKYKKCHLSFDEKIDSYRQKGFPVPNHSLLKSQADIDGIKKSGALTSQLLDGLNDIIKPGITTEDIDNWVHDQIIKHGATPATLNYKGYPKSCCTSINDVVCHGIPDNTVLEDGDIINVDITSVIDGYYGDSCRMYSVGNISKEAQKLVTVAKECLDKGIDAVQAWRPVSDIGKAIQAHAHKHNYGVVEMFGGHGVGNAFHEEPFIYHYERKDKQMIMVPGMVFTIEPMINIGTPHCEILDDDWTAVTADGSLSAQWEHTLLVTENGAEILTL
jgi:methionyl aminopeptidase